MENWEKFCLVCLKTGQTCQPAAVPAAQLLAGAGEGARAMQAAGQMAGSCQVAS